MTSLHGLATRALTLADPEDAHRLAILGLRAGLGPRRSADDPALAIDLAGLSLPNPVGLAAGFDKNAEVGPAMLAAGFGFVECGTVTPLPQAGNPRPRLFRLTEDAAVINRMGFNNAGLEAFAGELKRPRRGVLGANIGANKDSPDRTHDYVTGLTRLWGLGEALKDLLGRLAETRRGLAGHAPLFLKAAPDLDDAGIEAIAEAVAEFGFDGVILGNTTLDRPASLTSRWRGETGGLSGAPLMAPSTRVLRLFHQAARGRFVLIGAGGIAGGADAYAKIRAGARAVQLYSALVFHGPGLVMAIRRDLRARLKADGFARLADAVGAA